MKTPDDGQIKPEEVVGMKFLDLLAGPPEDDIEKVLRELVPVLDEDKKVQKEAGTVHFDNIDFSDLEKRDIGAYLRFREPVKRCEWMSKEELFADVENQSERYESMDNIFDEFSALHKELQNELKNEPDKKKALSRRDFWAFIANKITPVYMAWQMHKIKLTAAKKKKK